MTKSFLIALPVRNGGEHFRECVRSVLAQTYPHFELLVLDNASTDDSIEWLRSQDDPRIRLVQSLLSLGIEDSWGRLMTVSTAHDFMTVTGHDDIFYPDFLETINGLIDAHPDAGLYHTHYHLIDGQGGRIRPCTPMPARERDHEFLAARLSLRRDSFGTGYVFRPADYLRVGGIPLYRKLLFADDVLWLRLMEGSYRATHPGRHFAYRVHTGSASYSPDWRPTFEALHSYLAFLKQAVASPQIAAVLRAGLCEYMRFWFRWAHFSGGGNTEQLRQKIRTMVAEVRAIDGPSATELERSVEKYLFGAFAAGRWWVWRALRWARIRLACQFG